MTNKTTVLALKYRPQVFDDLIGQEIIAETIYNSIKHNKNQLTHICLLEFVELEKLQLLELLQNL